MYKKELFNSKDLSKQCCRLMTCPDSLMARVFQAKYYPHGSFLEATRGARPSSTWTSILHARDYFSRGIRIRIGHGYNTPILGCPWLRDDGNFQVITPQNHYSFQGGWQTLLIPSLTPGNVLRLTLTFGLSIGKEFSLFL